jgi:hypothetical protein
MKKKRKERVFGFLSSKIERGNKSQKPCFSKRVAVARGKGCEK